jgi:hypothetical protein
MEKFSLHASGQNKQLDILKENFLRLKKQLQDNRDLSEQEKIKRINALKLQFNREKESLINNLY